MLFWILFAACVALLGSAAYAVVSFQARRFAARREEEKRHRRAAELRRQTLDQTCAQILAGLSDSRRVG